MIIMGSRNCVHYIATNRGIGHRQFIYVWKIIPWSSLENITWLRVQSTFPLLVWDVQHFSRCIRRSHNYWSVRDFSCIRGICTLVLDLWMTIPTLFDWKMLILFIELSISGSAHGWKSIKYILVLEQRKSRYLKVETKSITIKI